MNVKIIIRKKIMCLSQSSVDNKLKVDNVLHAKPTPNVIQSHLGLCSLVQSYRHSYKSINTLINKSLMPLNKINLTFAFLRKLSVVVVEEFLLSLRRAP